MKKLHSKNNGITLVALVVTVIILLILAGISIASLTGSGLFEKAKLAKEKQENAQAYEDITLGDYENAIGEYVDSAREQITVDKAEYEQLLKDVAYLKENAIKYTDYGSEPIKTITTYGESWTATEDCTAVLKISTTGNSAIVYVNNQEVAGVYISSKYSGVLYLKKGDVISTRDNNVGQVYDIKIYSSYK